MDYKKRIRELKSSLPPMDYLLIGDGSGQNEEGAWAVRLYNLVEGTTDLFAGAISHTTNNVMELHGYIVVLGELYRRGIRGPRVLICSDSNVTVQCGQGRWKRKSNTHWWAALDEISDQLDAKVQFYHIERNSIPEAEEADRLAGQLRVLLEEFISEKSELSLDTPSSLQ